MAVESSSKLHIKMFIKAEYNEVWKGKGKDLSQQAWRDPRASR
jgi:hypothetical protein